MNAQDWLEQATKEMPEAVRRRVQAETLAHLEDAGVGEGEDVRAVLGEPKAMRRELGRLYVPKRRLRVLVEDSFPSSAYLLPCFGLLIAFFGIRVDRDPVYDGLLQNTFLALGLWLLTLFSTRNLPAVHRRLWHDTLGSILFNLCLWFYWLDIDLFSGWSVVVLLIWPLLQVSSLWKTWHEDRRLRRTLALVGGAQP